MHYTANSELPPDPKNDLPEEAQTLYREVFNGNFPVSRRNIRTNSEQLAHEAAWRAIREQFQNLNGRWVRK